jgi:hypothetical protein
MQDCLVSSDVQQVVIAWQWLVMQ